MHDQPLLISAAYMTEQSLPIIHRYAFICQWQLYNPDASPWRITKQAWQITEHAAALYQQEDDCIAGRSIQIHPLECFMLRKAIMLPSPFAQLSLALTLQNMDTQMIIDKSALLALNFDSRLIQ